MSLTVVTALAVGWAIWSTQQQWDQLDYAADDFRVPPGFTEVARPRQGSGFCWVTCTNGGEAVVIRGEDEAARSVVAVKDLRRGQQFEVADADLADVLLQARDLREGLLA